MAKLNPSTALEFNDQLTILVNSYNAALPPHEEGSHSRISPSKISQTIMCPASLQLQEDSRLPKDTTNAAAERGTALHEVMQKTLTAIFEAPHDLDAWSTAFQVLDEHEESLALTRALSATHKLMDVMSAHTYPEGDVDEQMEVRDVIVTKGFCEQRVCVSEQWDIYGTVDLWWLDANLCLHILDYKFGKTPVEVEENSQLKAYALGLASMIPDTVEIDGEQVSLMNEGFKVYLHVVQPDVLGDTAATWSTNVYDLVSWWGQTVVPTLMDVSGPFGRASLNPSPVACKWCKASAICAARAAMTSQEASRVFASMADISQRTLSDEKVFLLYEDVTSMEAAIKAVKTYVRYTLASGPKAGYKLVAARGKRAWVNEEDEALHEYLASLEEKIPNFEYITSKLVTAPALLKKYTKLKKDEKLDKFIHKVPGKTLSIVPESDPREAITSTNPFEGLEDDDDEGGLE